MDVEFQKMPIIKRFAHRQKIYEVEQDSGFERVMVDGGQVGLVPNNTSDPNYRVLHPLSKGFPQEFLEMVVMNSKGRLERTLRGPVPLPTEETDDEPEGED
jgi:hypothetical protein